MFAVSISGPLSLMILELSNKQMGITGMWKWMVIHLLMHSSNFWNSSECFHAIMIFYFKRCYLILLIMAIYSSILSKSLMQRFQTIPLTISQSLFSHSKQNKMQQECAGYIRNLNWHWAHQQRMPFVLILVWLSLTAV